MIESRDEYLHEYKKNSRWIEKFSVNFIDRKNRIFGFADINFLFLSKEIEFIWKIFYGDDLYGYSNYVDFDGGLNQKIFTDKNVRYKVKVPGEIVDLELKNESLHCSLSLTGAYPIYVFPRSIPDRPDQGRNTRQVEWWERYEQRCRMDGTIVFKKGGKKGIDKKIDGVGFRKHSWGERYPEDMSSYSWLTIQFRDMSIDLTYMEIDNISFSSGFISKKSGNIPIMSVEQELFSLSRDRKSLLSAEFSYQDAQEDRDLIVSKKIHSVDMPVPKSKKQKYIRLRSFSEFMVIGTGKRGIGMEEHYISLEKLQSML